MNESVNLVVDFKSNMKKCKDCWKKRDHDNALISRCMDCQYKKQNIKRKAVKKISDKRKKRLSEYSEKDMFKEIWQERNHNCEECWKYLREAKAHNFSHIKSKWSRPDLRMDKDNIKILCFRCHFKNDMWLDYKWPDLN